MKNFKHILACFGLVSCATPDPQPTIENIICRGAQAHRKWDFFTCDGSPSIAERARVSDAYGEYVDALSTAGKTFKPDDIKKAEEAMLNYVELVNQVTVPAVP